MPKNLQTMTKRDLDLKEQGEYFASTHDRPNTLCATLEETQEYHYLTVLPHSPHSPDLLSCDQSGPHGECSRTVRNKTSCFE